MNVPVLHEVHLDATCKPCAYLTENTVTNAKTNWFYCCLFRESREMHKYTVGTMQNCFLLHQVIQNIVTLCFKKLIKTSVHKNTEMHNKN